MLKCNPGIVANFWSVFQEFSFQIRYNFYNEWIINVQFSHPVLIMKTAICLKDTKKWLKRLTKDKVKQNSRSLGKLSHNNPIVVFNELIKTMKSYSNQISSMISSLNYCSVLSLDTTLFTILRAISDPNKDKLNNVSANLESWLLNIAEFTGLFLKKNYNVKIF